MEDTATPFTAQVVLRLPFRYGTTEAERQPKPNVKTPLSLLVSKLLLAGPASTKALKR